MNTENQSTIDNVKHYYGEVLKSSKDLKTSACCPTEAMPSRLQPLLEKIHPEIRERFYGCGCPLPQQLEGCTVLDLGCGTGRDCYLISQLVGQEGRVLGIDMTDEQLQIAQSHLDYQMSQFGFQKPNVQFIKGYIEDLKEAGIASNSVDAVVSNCVVNLSPAKDRVFSEIFRVLKEGGELYFSDVYADRRIPESLKTDPVLVGECLGGALYWEDFRRLMTAVGFLDFRTIDSSALSVTNPELRAKLGPVQFRSVTVRAFKLSSLEDRCEDFGQSACYLGTLEESPSAFVLDDHHTFKAGSPMRVCGNSAAMVAETRFANHFKILGDKTTHFGLFDCGPNTPPETKPGAAPCC